MEWYRDDLEEARSRDPYPVLKQQLLDNGFTKEDIETIENSAKAKVQSDFEKALKAEDPKPEDLFTNDFVPTPITEEKGNDHQKERKSSYGRLCLFAVEELMRNTKNACCMDKMLEDDLEVCFVKQQH